MHIISTNITIHNHLAAYKMINFTENKKIGTLKQKKLVGVYNL